MAEKLCMHNGMHVYTVSPNMTLLSQVTQTNVLTKTDSDLNWEYVLPIWRQAGKNIAPHKRTQQL